MKQLITKLRANILETETGQITYLAWSIGQPKVLEVDRCSMPDM